MEQAPHTGAPHTGDARTARTVHALLGDRGTIGDDARTAVGYAFHERCNAYHIAPVRAYARARDRMNYGTGDARVTWPLRAYVAEGTGAVVVRDMNDLASVAAMSKELRASLARERYIGSPAWRMRAMERAGA